MYNYGSFSASVSNIKMIFITHALPHPAQSFSFQWHIPCKKPFVIKLCVESSGKGEILIYKTSKWVYFIIFIPSLLNFTQLPFHTHILQVLILSCQVLPGLASIGGVQSQDKRHCCQCPFHLLFFLDWWWQTTLYRSVYPFVIPGC